MECHAISNSSRPLLAHHFYILNLSNPPRDLYGHTLALEPLFRTSYNFGRPICSIHGNREVDFQRNTSFYTFHPKIRSHYGRGHDNYKVLDCLLIVQMLNTKNDARRRTPTESNGSPKWPKWPKSVIPCAHIFLTCKCMGVVKCLRELGLIREPILWNLVYILHVLKWK